MLLNNEFAKIKDYNFFNRTMFLFENNRYANSIFINEIKDKEYSDFSNCTNIRFDNVKACITLKDETSKGTYTSSIIRTHTEEESFINNFFLIVDEDKPIGTDIIYYILTNENDKIKILPNEDTPLIINSLESPKSFRFIADLQSNGMTTPKINSFSIMYYDSVTDENLKLKQPDITGPSNLKTVNEINIKADVTKETIVELEETIANLEETISKLVSRIEKLERKI